MQGLCSLTTFRRLEDPNTLVGTACSAPDDPCKSPNILTEQSAIRRTAVMVLGMHRSGTSALTGVLGHLGCDLPQMLIHGDQFNTKGYYECVATNDLNEEIVASAGSAWHDWQEFNPKWMSSPKADDYKDKALSVLRASFGTSRLFVLKDPRICRFAPFWLDVLDQAGCRPAIICTHRNPLDVAASLQRRDGLPLAYGLLLWLRHVLDGEAATRGQVRAFTSYGALMRNWAGVARRLESDLNLAWPRFSAQVAREIEDFLAGELRHFESPTERVLDNPLLSEWQSKSFAILERWAETGEVRDDYPTLDLIRAQFNAAAPAFADLIMTGQETARSLAAATQELSVSKTRMVDSEAALQNHQQTAQSLADEVSQSQAARTALDQQLASAQQAIADGAQAANQAAAALAAMGGEADDLRQSLAQRQQALAALQSQTEQHQFERAEAQAQSAILAARIAGANDEVVELRHTLAERQSKVEGLEMQLSRQRQDQIALEQTSQTLADEVSQSQAERTALDQQLAAAQQAIADGAQAANQAAAALAAMGGEADDLRQSLAQRQQALAALQSQIEQHQSERAEAQAQSDMLVARIAGANDEAVELRHTLAERQSKVEGLETQLSRQRQDQIALEQTVTDLATRVGDGSQLAAQTEVALKILREDLLQTEERLDETIDSLRQVSNERDHLRSTVQQRAQEIDDLTLALRRTVTETEDLRSQMTNQRDIEIGLMRTELQGLGAEKLAFKAEASSERDRAERSGALLRQVTEELTLRGAELAASAQTLRQRDIALSDLAAQLDRQEASHRARLAESLAVADEQARQSMATQEAESARLRADLAAKAVEAAQLAGQIAELVRRYNAITESTSWRMTSPLRRLMIALRSLTGRSDV